MGTNKAIYFYTNFKLKLHGYISSRKLVHLTPLKIKNIFFIPFSHVLNYSALRCLFNQTVVMAVRRTVSGWILIKCTTNNALLSRTSLINTFFWGLNMCSDLDSGIKLCECQQNSDVMVFRNVGLEIEDHIMFSVINV